MNFAIKKFCIGLLISVFVFPAMVVFAEDTSSVDESSLFGSTDDIFGGSALVTDVEESEIDIASSLLVSESVDLGGSYSLSVRAGTIWSGLETVTDVFNEYDSTYLSTSLSTSLYLDARPDEDFRVFGKTTVHPSSIN